MNRRKWIQKRREVMPVDWSIAGLTNAELTVIRSDLQLLQITTFYRNGKPVPSPF
jgi:hypothetical protein